MVIIEQESIHSFRLKIINWDRRGHHNKKYDYENKILGTLIDLSSIYRTDIEIKCHFSNKRFENCFRSVETFYPALMACLFSITLKAYLTGKTSG